MPSQTDPTGREQAEHRVKADLAALTLLHGLSTKLLAVDKLESLLQEIVDAAVALVEAERGTLQLIEGESLRLVAQHGHQPPFLKFFAAESRASVCGESLRRGERVLVEDVERSPLFRDTVSLRVLRDAGVRAVQSTPLCTRQGRFLGILTTQWSVPYVPDEHDLWRIDLLARQAADLVEHKQAEEALRNANEDLRARAEQLETANNMLLGRQQELESANRDLLAQEQQAVSHTEALRDKEAELELILNRTPFLLTRCSRDLRYRYVSRAYAEMIGRTPGQVAGRPILEIMGPEGFETIRPYVDTVLKGQPVEYEAPIHFQGVGARLLHVTYVPDRDAQGDVVGWVASILDITEHKRVEDALGESEKHLALAASGTRIGMYEWDAATGKALWTEQVEQLLGLRTTTTTTTTAAATTTFSRPYHYRDWAERVHPEDWPRIQAEFHRCMTERAPCEAEYRIVWPDGTVHWLAGRGVFQYGSDGQCTRMLGLVMDITQRKQAEEALRQNQALMHAVLEGSPDLIYMKDLDGRVLMVNRAACEMLGRSAKDVIGHNARELHRDDPEVGRAILENDRRIMASGQMETTEELGSKGRIYLSTKAPYRDAAGKIIGLLGISHDITERKRAEEALKESQKTFAELIERAPYGIYVVDSRFRIAVMNAGSQTGAFRNVRPVIGRDFGEAMRILWPEPIAAEIIAVFRHTLETGEPYYSPCFTNPRHDVETVESYEWELHRMTLPDGQYGVICYYYDSTKLREAEAALRELNATLENKVAQRTAEVERERRRLYAVLEAMPAMVCLLTPDYHIAFANRSFRERFGEANGRHCYESCYGRTEPCDFCEAYEVLKTGRPHRWEVTSRDGRTIVEAHDYPFTDVDGSPLILEMDLDITERKRAEAALRELNETVSQRARQLQKLALALSEAEDRERRRIAVILHEDLQQQIAGAKFHLTLARNRVSEDRRRREIDIVDAMLKEAIEKSRTLSHDLSPAVLHMNDLAEVLQWLANRMQAQHGLRVSVKVWSGMMLPSEALATFLFRAAQEMLFNVVKHAHVSEAAIRVRRIEHYVCLSVSDQGQGFDPQELKETSGFGLFSICERAELLGGRLRVKSAKGKGSRFSLVVPDGRPVVAPPPSRVNLLRPGAAGLPSNGTLRVLLVDDHEAVRQGLAAMLRGTPGIELVGEAPGGREAVNLAAGLQPDVVIMDVSMPVMSGAQATQQIKAYLPETRVIALSMYDETKKRQKMFEAGAEGYILKTVSAEELLAALRGDGAESQG